MPIGFSSPARNLFLLGGSGEGIVTNFFRAIARNNNESTIQVTSNQYVDTTKTFYTGGDNRYLSSAPVGTANRRYGFVEERDIDGILGNKVEVAPTYANTDLDLADFFVDSSDNIIACGFTPETGWIAKYDSSGGLVWSSTSNTSDAKYRSVAESSDGSYYICGTIQGDFESETDNTTSIIEKFDSNGNPLWGRNISIAGGFTIVRAIALNSNNEIYVCGYVEDDTIKASLVKLSEDGDVIWDRTFESYEEGIGILGGYKAAGFYDITIDGKDQIFLVGSLLGTSSVEDGIIVKLNPQGNIEWQKQTTGEDVRYQRVKSDSETGQSVVTGIIQHDTLGECGIVTKYSGNGTVVFRRLLRASEANSPTNAFDRIALDADPSYYYLAFTDRGYASSGAPDNDRYIYGRVSTSGNGLGDFEYEFDGNNRKIDYVIDTFEDRIGRLDDGSVRNDTSDLVTYPFGANDLMFDDYATIVSNKKVQISEPNIYAYSGSPSIRPADFQELNLLGAAGISREKGKWEDQSGKGNDGEVLVTDILKEPHPDFGSVKFDGVDDYLSIPDTQLLEILEEDFTVEFWIYVTGTRAQQCIFSKSRNVQCYWTDDNTIALYLDSDNNSATGTSGYGVFFNSNLTGTDSVMKNQWHHVAICRDNNTWKAFVDGVQKYSNSIPGLDPVYNSSDDFEIGSYANNRGQGSLANEFEGFISNFRWVKGEALYLSNFTVPSTPLTPAGGSPAGVLTSLLTCQGTGAIVDAKLNTPNVITANGGVTTTSLKTAPSYNDNGPGYWEFDGDDDFIDLGTQPVDSDLNASSPSGGGLTVEWWGYYNGTGDSFQRIIDRSNSGGAGNGWAIYTGGVGSTTEIRLSVDGESTLLTSTELIDANVWQHWMVSWNQGSGDWAWYKNGVAAGTGNATYSIPAVETGMRIGTWNHSTGREYNGSIGEVRVYPRALTAAQVFQNYNSTKTKYINEAPEITPNIGPNIVQGSDLILNYDFESKACYDDTSNLLPDTIDILNDWSSGPNGPIETSDVASPIGTYDVFKVTTSSTDQNAIVYEAIDSLTTQGFDYTFSFWVKSIDGSTGTWGVNYFSNGHNRQTVPITGEWKRVSFSFTAGSGGENIYIGDNRDGLASINEAYVWGPQLNRGNTLNSFVRTYGSAVTAPTIVKNLSSSSYPGTINGGAAFSRINNPGYFEFSGVSADYIEPTITIPASARSYFIWIRYNSITSLDDGYSLTGCQEVNAYTYLGIEENDALGAYFYYYIGTQGQAITGTLLQANTWYQQGVVMNADGTRELYLNGSSIATVSSGSIGSANTQTFRLGKVNDHHFVNGGMGGLLLYTRALSATEVSQNFNATRAKYGV